MTPIHKSLVYPYPVDRTPCLTIVSVDGIRLHTERKVEPAGLLAYAEILAAEMERIKPQIEKAREDLALYGSSVVLIQPASARCAIT